MVVGTILVVISIPSIIRWIRTITHLTLRCQIQDLWSPKSIYNFISQYCPLNLSRFPRRSAVILLLLSKEIHPLLFFQRPIEYHYDHSKYYNAKYYTNYIHSDSPFLCIVPERSIPIPIRVNIPNMTHAAIIHSCIIFLRMLE